MKDNKNISVWLIHNNKVRRDFRCCNCGKIVFEYFGDTKLIIAGTNEVESPTIVQCKGVIEKHDIMGNKFNQRCHTKYVIS